MEKLKKILKIALRVYTIFCACVFTVLLIAGITAWVNRGKITAKVIENVVENYNSEINDVISGYFETAAAGNSVKFESIQTVKGGGLQAAFSVNDNMDLNGYKDKSNEELIAELGLTANDIPDEIKPLLSMVKETLVLDFKDKNGKDVFSRAISTKEIMELLGK